jgi:hypothetical protein
VHNLYGVDLNAEAIQICQLSLWIKTAARGKQLTSLDHTIREGKSVISDKTVHPKAFDWQAAFPEVFAQGGFDVVVGNPPYIRQELLSPFKPWLEAHYEVFHGMADLYVCFYELGVRMLKPGGLLCFIVTNQWMKAGYGEPLRRVFSEKAWVRSVVNFGHAKQIFEEVDVFPSIIFVEKPNEAPSLHRHLKLLEEPLRERRNKRRLWRELRPRPYCETFERPKISCQEIQSHPGYALGKPARPQVGPTRSEKASI